MPNQAQNTLSGNWRARFVSEFYDQRGRQWRVELIDSDLTGYTDFGFTNSVPTNHRAVELTSEGFNLSWDGPTDHIGAAIIPSSCSLTYVLTTADTELLKNVIKTANDSRLGIAIYYDDGGADWQPYWVGLLNHEAIEYETQDLPNLVTLNANCGLNRLSSVEYKASNGSVYLEDDSIAETFARCINKIPTANFWMGTENQMCEVVDLFSETHINLGNYASWATNAGDSYPISMIERTVISSATFSQGGEQKEDEFGRRIKNPPNFNSCLDVLENIAAAFSARILLARHAFWFFPTNAYNWSHNLNVQKWTRTQVSSETIQTQIVSSQNKDTSTAAQTNFRFDIDATHALENGWSNSYLLPVKRCVLTFKNAGLRSVFGQPRSGILDKGNTGPNYSSGFSNQGIVVTEQDSLKIKGTYSGELVKEYGTGFSGAPSHGEDRIGARIILRFKIKVNSASGTAYYYGSEYSVTNTTCNIDMPVGWNGEGTNPQRVFNKLDLADASWSTNEKFFDVVIPWTTSNPNAPSTSSGDYIVGGLHLQSDALNTFKYRIGTLGGGTQQDTVAHTFDFTTLPLPAALSAYTGIEVYYGRVAVTRNGTLKQTFPELRNIFTPCLLNQSYNYDGSNNSSNNSAIPNDRIDDFLCIVGEEAEDADWDYFVEQTENTEMLDLGETTIGSNYTQNGAGSDGSVRLITHNENSLIPTLHSTSAWKSVTDEIGQDEDPSDLQYMNLIQNLYMRGKPLDVQRGSIVPQVTSNSNVTQPMDILSVMHHNCSTPQDVEEYLIPMTFTHIAGLSRYNVDAVKIGQQRLSWESDEGKVPKGPNGGGGSGAGGGGVAPNGGDSGVPVGGTSDGGKPDIIAEEVASVKSFLSDSQTNPPSAGQTKLLVLNSAGQLTQIADGTSGQVLSSNGSGVYSFIDPPASQSQTTTPTGAVDDDTPNQGATVTWTATNYDGVTTYIPVLKLASNGATVLSGTSFTQNGAVVTYTHPSNTTPHTLSITAVSAGKTESAAWTDTITGAAHVSTWEYLRLQVVDTTNGNAVSKPIKVIEVASFTGTSQSGTDNPTTNATGGSSNNSGLSDFVITHGFSGSQGTQGFHAFDGSTSTGWSSSGIPRSGGANNWCQIQFLSAKQIQSGTVIIDASNTTAPCDLKIMVSNTGAFSGEETTLTTLQDVGTGSGNITHNWTL